MNVVSALHHREQGKRIRWDLNIALKRLKCHDYDEFRGIVPSTEGPDFNPEPPVFACAFCTTPNFEHLLALANEDGKIAIQDTNLRSNHNPFEGHQAHHNAIFDIAWAPNEMQLVSASGDHTAVLWDVHETGALQEVARFHAHTRSVKTVAFPREDKNIFATGARDGVIMLWDTRTQRNQLAVKPDNSICNSHSAPGTPGNSSGNRNRRVKATPSRASSITSLLFQDNHSLISCGAGDGKIKVWDIRKSYSTYRREPQPKYSMSTPNASGRSGFTCLALDPGGLKLYASCMDNTIYCFNIGTYEDQPVGLFRGHKNCTFYVKACLSPDGRYLLSGSSDEMAYIWDTCSPKGDVYMPIVKLVGHTGEVTSVAWCPVGEIKIVTCADDARHCLWRVGEEFRGDNYQVELRGWAEVVSDGVIKPMPSSPATPATPSFTSWRRWTPCVQRTPDNLLGLADTTCEVCHRLSTPCLRCIATRAPLPISVPHGSKKRLEILWEEDSGCPECEREGRPALNQVTNNLDAPARRLFSPTKQRTSDEEAAEENLAKKHMSVGSSSLSKKHAMIDPVMFCEPSPKKSCTSLDVANMRCSPRKRCKTSQIGTPQKRFKVNEDASCSKDHNEPGVGTKCKGDSVPHARKKVETLKASSPRKKIKLSPDEQLPGPSSPLKKSRDTPVKRRISDRPTDSPHKRIPPNDDLQGISKMDESQPPSLFAHNKPRRLCVRHTRMGFSSPTMNLPNYVLDGTSPHHRCSPVHHHKENVDWLTRLRRERNSTDKKLEQEQSSEQSVLSKPSSSGKAPSQTTPGKASSSRVMPGQSSSSRVTPAKSSRRTTPAKSRTTPTKPCTPAAATTPKQPSKKTPGRRPSNSDASSSSGILGGAPNSLLKFFRVSEKPIEQQCSISNTPAKPVNSISSVAT